MMLAGAVIAGVFGGGLALFLWVDTRTLMQGATNATHLMTTVLIGPIVGLAPALLGVVLAQKGWRRLRRSGGDNENRADR